MPARSSPERIWDHSSRRSTTTAEPSSGRRSPTARSSTRRSARSTTCPSAGATNRRPGGTGWNGDLTNGPSGTSSGRPAGRAIPSRPECRSGGPAATASAPRSRPIEPEPAALAFLGVRGCELAALRVQDRVLMDGPVADPDYAARRRAALVIAVECTVSGATCFCTSMGTGPEIAGDEPDMVLTEMDDGFLVRTPSATGAALASRLPLAPATDEQVGRGRAAVAAVREAIGNPVDIEGLPGRLMARLDDPHWAEIADRCLACANCTLVCPTCFCTSVTQRSDLDGLESVSERSWDSCFSGDFAKVAGGNFRSRREDRYRQWLTHKFSTWVDQFGSFGCVGCGRCITWCPVGIDVREELLAIARPPARRPLPVAVATEPGAFVPARVERTFPETPDTTTLVLADVDPRIASGRPGQFVMVDAAGLPAVPISSPATAPSSARSSCRSGPQGRRRHRSATSPRARRSGFADRSDGAGRPTRPRVATSSSSPAGSASRRCVRSSTRCWPNANGSGQSGSSTAPGRQRTDHTGPTSKRGRRGPISSSPSPSIVRTRPGPVRSASSPTCSTAPNGTAARPSRSSADRSG